MKQQKQRDRLKSVEKLQVKFWMSAVLEQMPERSLNGLHQRLQASGIRVSGDHSRFSKYKNGLRRPSIRKAGDIVSQLEVVAPRTARIYRAPFWQVLQGKTIGSATLTNSLVDIGSTHSRIVLSTAPSNSRDQKAKHRTYGDVFWQLAHFPDFDLMQVIVLHLGYAIEGRNDVLWLNMVRFYKIMMPQFINIIDNPMKADLLDAVDEFIFEESFLPKSVLLKNYNGWRSEEQRAARYNDLSTISVLDSDVANLIKQRWNTLASYFERFRYSVQREPREQNAYHELPAEDFGTISDEWNAYSNSDCNMYFESLSEKEAGTPVAMELPSDCPFMLYVARELIES